MICVFKCVACGDKMHYSVRKKMLVCDTCHAECEIENYEIENMTYEGKATLSESLEMMSCPTCGARVVLKEGEAKVSCSYCHSELAAFGARRDELSPEKIIPCKLSFQQARVKLYDWWSNHDTMPKYDEKKLRMKFQDIYVPVWLVDAEASAYIRAKIAPFDYYGNSNLPDRPESKFIACNYFHVPFDSSCHILDEQFYNIEPFTYSEMVDFDPSYLAGHAAECYHIEPEYVIPRAIGRLKNFAKQQAREYLDGSIGGGHILDILYEETDITPTELTYALVPMWVCTYTYGGKKYNVYVNGQTGKVDGDVLFAGKSLEKKVFGFGITSVILGFALGFVSVLIFLSMDMIMSYNQIYMAMLFAWPIVTIAAMTNLSIKAGMQMRGTYRQKMGKINDEFLARQGSKVNVTVQGAINLMVAGITMLVGMIFVYPPARTFGVDMTMVTFITIIITFCFASLQTMLFAKKLIFYETYKRKTTYMDYIKATSVREINEAV